MDAISVSMLYLTGEHGGTGENASELITAAAEVSSVSAYEERIAEDGTFKSLIFTSKNQI